MAYKKMKNGNVNTVVDEKTARANKKRRNDLAVSIGMWIVFGLMLIHTITFLFMYGWVVVQSFNDTIGFGINPFAFPQYPSFNNYVTAFNAMQVKLSVTEIYYIEDLLLNSGIYIVIASLVATFTPIFVAYVTNKFDFKFSKVVDGIVVLTMVLPIVNARPSELAMTRTLGVYNTFFVMVLLRLTFLGTNYLYAKSAFKGIGNSYGEAAEIDGAGYFRIFIQIDLPMIGNITTILLILQVMGFWADWELPYTFMPSHPTAAFGLYQLQFTTVPELVFEGVKFAACLMASIPSLIIFVIFRDKMMGGLSFGGLKG